MLPKPDTCIGCPLYGNGFGFVPGHFPEGAAVAVIGQNPGEEEEHSGVPLVGKTGKYLDDTFLPLPGLDPKEIARDNAIRCRWQGHGNSLPEDYRLDEAIRHCSCYDRFDGIELVVAMGVVALRKLAPQLKQHEWRGFLTPERSDI